MSATENEFCQRTMTFLRRVIQFLTVCQLFPDLLTQFGHWSADHGRSVRSPRERPSGRLVYGSEMVAFGIKTPPQHGPWADFLDVWRAADDIDDLRIGVDDGPLLPAHSPARRPPPGELDGARRPGPGNHTTAPRMHGQRHALSASGRHRQRRRDRSITSPADGSTSASVPGGSSRSPTPTASRWDR